MPKDIADTIIIEAPDVRLYVYDSHNPKSVNTVAIIPDKNIIDSRELLNFSAIYTGIVSIAITSISPTTLMAITTVKADNINIKV